jgi:hypothetical protein
MRGSSGLREGGAAVPDACLAAVLGAAGPDEVGGEEREGYMSRWDRSPDADGKALHRAIKAFKVHLAKEERESVKGVGGVCTTADFSGGGDEGFGSGRDVRRGGRGFLRVLADVPSCLRAWKDVYRKPTKK